MYTIIITKKIYFFSLIYKNGQKEKNINYDDRKLKIK